MKIFFWHFVQTQGTDNNPTPAASSSDSPLISIVQCKSTLCMVENSNTHENSFDGDVVWSTTALVVESYTTTHFLTDTLVLPSKQQIGWDLFVVWKTLLISVYQQGIHFLNYLFVVWKTLFISVCQQGFIFLTLFLKILFLNRMCVSPNRGGGGTMQLDDCLHMHQTSRTKNEQEFGYAVWLSQNIVFDRAGNRYGSLSFCLCRGVFVVVSLSLCLCRFFCVVGSLSWCLCRCVSVVVSLSWCFFRFVFAVVSLSWCLCRCSSPPFCGSCASLCCLLLWRLTLLFYFFYVLPNKTFYTYYTFYTFDTCQTFRNISQFCRFRHGFCHGCPHEDKQPLFVGDIDHGGVGRVGFGGVWCLRVHQKEKQRRHLWLLHSTNWQWRWSGVFVRWFCQFGRCVRGGFSWPFCYRTGTFYNFYTEHTHVTTATEYRILRTRYTPGYPGTLPAYL